MKKMFVLLGLVLTQGALALPNATDRLNSLLPYGTFDGDDCRVRVTRTFTGNIKVSVSNLLYRVHVVVPKNQFYRYLPGKYFAVKIDKKSNSTRQRNYLFLSYRPEGLNVLVGKSLSSPGEFFDRNVDCTIN